MAFPASNPFSQAIDAVDVGSSVMDDDDEHPEGGLSSLSEDTATPDAHAQALKVLQDAQRDKEAGDAQIGALQRSQQERANAARTVLQNARAQLLAKKYNTAPAWLAMGAALSKPTQNGSFVQSLGNAAGAVEPYANQKSAWADKRDQQVTGYDSELANFGTGANATSPDMESLALKLAQLKQQQAGLNTRSALTTLSKPTSVGAKLQGKDGLNYDPSTGKYTDSTGRVLTSEEVQKWGISKAVASAAGTEAARNKAKMDALPAGSVDAMVEDYLQNNRVPSGARTNPAMTAKFWQAVEDRAIKDGNSLSAQMAATKARASVGPALTQTTKQLAANRSFADVMHKNIADADGLEKQMGGFDSPLMNRAYQAWKKGVTGDPEVAPIVAKLDFWNNAIQGEAAKIASGGVGSVVAGSDTQIAKQVKLLNTAQSYAVWKEVASAMQKESQNRVSSLTDEISNLSNMSQTAQPAAAAAPKETAAARAARLGLK